MPCCIYLLKYGGEESNSLQGSRHLVRVTIRQSSHSGMSGELGNLKGTPNSELGGEMKGFPEGVILTLSSE